MIKMKKGVNRQSSSRKYTIISYLILLALYLLTFFIFPLAEKFIKFILTDNRSETQKLVLNEHKNEEGILTQQPYLCEQSSDANYSNSISNSRDAILLYATRYTTGLDLALKSLKSTRSKAQVILFTHENEFYANPEAKDFLNSMNVKIINNCQEDPNVTQARGGITTAVPHMLRFKCERDWIKENLKDFDRVLHSDAYDIFFQKDPFKPYEGHDLIGYDHLTFVVEPHFIRGCGWNLAWFTHCYGPDTTRLFEDNFIICSGTIAGSASDYLKLVEMMISQEEWKTCYSPSHDQPILNYLLWSGKIKDAGIKYSLAGCDGGFATLQWCTLNMRVDYNEFGQVVLPSKIVPPYVHQYPRIPGLTEHLREACNRRSK